MSHNKYDVCVIGLGYVGLTLATVLSEVGLRVLGVEKRQSVVEMTANGRPHFSEAGLQEALSRVTSANRLVAVTELPEGLDCGIFIITVGTPLNSDGVARLDMIEAASGQVARYMADDALVILRSTVKIGTARNVVSPILRQSGKRFAVAMCPERTLEGRALQELRELPQIVGADDQATRDRASSLFRQLTSSVVQVSSLEAAEVIKLVDNTFRDVQFAFANEVARLCDAFGISAHEVISLGKLGYKRTNVPLPGLVGGPCLEKDPHILRESAQSRGIELEITRASRLVNERQPAETVSFISSKAKARGIADDAKIAILGMAFKGVPATDDLRGSMSSKVLHEIARERPKAAIYLYDPVVSREELAAHFPNCEVSQSLQDAVRDAAVVIIANNHPALAAVSPRGLAALMSANGFIYDYWNHFSSLTSEEKGSSYLAVGTSGVGEQH
ncbi:nucleotide sugar dehydrogenase [Phreatobacter oligotrophus]|uniref:UDP-N-acetyl-D-mannosaminuronic acid dehydrogenase n=1 Tax=Phreatobacter oligotrophus TaxID=1122261 RepID=A0A2T4YP47_9HYPH|nr:nucleotide sugar dehydrogenase [Phreatobacter oligotrophus]PTM45286.1 UDP-N-acetyl-D-mannosaminuronic acid dehydrogenase [Phreatobacter oligotrophus]